MDEHLKLADRIVGFVDRPNRNVCVTPLCYTVDKPESSYGQIQKFAKRKEYEKFQQTADMNIKLVEFIYLSDVMNSPDEKLIADQSFCNFLLKVFATN